MNCLPGLDVYALLTVDLLHEFELGVWKALFTQIVRILSLHPGAVGRFDKRYPPVRPKPTYIDDFMFKIPPHWFIWKGWDPSVRKQRISNEEARRA